MSPIELCAMFSETIDYCGCLVANPITWDIPSVKPESLRCYPRSSTNQSKSSTNEHVKCTRVSLRRYGSIVLPFYIGVNIFAD